MWCGIHGRCRRGNRAARMPIFSICRSDTFCRAQRRPGRGSSPPPKARTFITTVTFERHIMKHSLKFAIVLSVLIAATLPATSHQAQTVTADAALAELKAGNAHHVRHQYQHPHETVARQRELLAAQ